MAKQFLNTLLGLLWLFSLSQFALADPPVEETKWGDFTGQLIYDGDPPEQKIHVPKKAGLPPVFVESLVVDPKSHGIANVFIYLRTPSKPAHPLAVHPAYAEQIKKPIIWTVKRTGYSPHVLLLHTGQRLIVKDVGGFVSNPKGFVDPGLGVLIPPKAPLEFQFPKPERLPRKIGCNIHAWFSAYLLVQDNPYSAVTDEDGKFTIKNLPVGEYEFQFWQERSGYVKLPQTHLRKVELAGDRDKGRLLLTIRPGENDLGEIKIAPQVFE